MLIMSRLSPGVLQRLLHVYSSSTCRASPIPSLSTLFCMRFPATCWAYVIMSRVSIPGAVNPIRQLVSEDNVLNKIFHIWRLSDGPLNFQICDQLQHRVILLIWYCPRMPQNIYFTYKMTLRCASTWAMNNNFLTQLCYVIGIIRSNKRVISPTRYLTTLSILKRVNWDQRWDERRRRRLVIISRMSQGGMRLPN